MKKWLIPDWPAPQSVRALTTLRVGGCSQDPYASFNFGSYVGDTKEAVEENRRILRVEAGLPSEPYWWKQVHGNHVVVLPTNIATMEIDAPEADVSVTFTPGQVCVVTTADCLPILLCDKAGTRVAAVHAGWRGIVKGVIETGVRALDIDPSELLVWFGPAIGPKTFEVGEDVKSFFTLPEDPSCFVPKGAGKWLMDIYAVARARLRRLGVTAVYGGDECTYTDSQRFYSYRRSGQTGRMANLIWITET